MNLKTKKYLKSFIWKDYLIVVLGLICYAIGLTGFLIPNKIVTGGLAGIALLIKYGTGVDVWISTLIINAFLLVAAWIVLGRKFMIDTLLGAFGLTFFIGIAEQYVPAILPAGDPLSIIVGGMFCGAGLGMVYSRNSTTGGSDIIAAIVTKYRYVSMGRVLMVVDLFIISSSWFLFQSLEKIIYGLIVAGVVYYVVDVVISGFRQSVQFFIFSNKYDEIASLINSEVHRGCTIVDGMGWYSKHSQKIIIVMARKTESTSIFRLVKSIDENAFITQTNVVGVYGKGFDQMK